MCTLLYKNITVLLTLYLFSASFCLSKTIDCEPFLSEVPYNVDGVSVKAVTRINVKHGQLTAYKRKFYFNPKYGGLSAFYSWANDQHQPDIQGNLLSFSYLYGSFPAHNLGVYYLSRLPNNENDLYDAMAKHPWSVWYVTLPDIRFMNTYIQFVNSFMPKEERSPLKFVETKGADITNNNDFIAMSIRNELPVAQKGTLHVHDIVLHYNNLILPPRYFELANKYSQYILDFISFARTKNLTQKQKKELKRVVDERAGDIDSILGNLSLHLYEKDKIVNKHLRKLLGIEGHEAFFPDAFRLNYLNYQDEITAIYEDFLAHCKFFERIELNESLFETVEARFNAIKQINRKHFIENFRYFSFD